MLERIKALIDEEKLQKRIEEIGSQISNEYNNEELILICQPPIPP